MEIKVPESGGSKESEEGDARHQTQQCKRTEGHYQSKLCLHQTSAVPQTGLHVTPRCCSNSCERGPDQVLMAVQVHTFQ